MEIYSLQPRQEGEPRATNPDRQGRVFAFPGFDFSKTAKIAKQYRQMSLA
jgi:hypothetical protein